MFVVGARLGSSQCCRLNVVRTASTWTSSLLHTFRLSTRPTPRVSLLPPLTFQPIKKVTAFQKLQSYFTSSGLNEQPTLPDPPLPPSPGEPAPVTVHKLDFVALGFPEYESRYGIVIDNLFTAEDCAKLLAAAEDSGKWELAQLNGGVRARQYIDTSYRNSGRIMLDDRGLADWILAKLRPHLGEIEKLNDGDLNKMFAGRKENKPVKISRLNERLRFLKYGSGQYFKPHCDGTYYTEDKKEVSYYTLHIYLNGDNESLVGGATRLWSGRQRAKGGKVPRFRDLEYRSETHHYLDVESRMGRVLVFEQQQIVHSGEEVTKGVKLSLRTEFMYEVDKT